MRVSVYLRFTFWIAGIPHYRYFVCGDDQLMLLERLLLAQFRIAFDFVFTDVKVRPEGEFGLG